MKDSSSGKKAIVVIIAVVALAAAVWSGVRTFAPQGRTIGHLGNLTEQGPPSVSAPAASVSPSQTPQQQEVSGGLAGAPAAAAKAGGGGNEP